MAKISGHGGYIIYNGKRIDNISWTITTEAVIDDVTDSSSNNWGEGLPILIKVQSFEFEVFDAIESGTPPTDIFVDELLGMIEGDTVTLYLKRGSLSATDVVQDTIVRSVRVLNDQQRARRIQVTCEYGVLVRA